MSEKRVEIAVCERHGLRYNAAEGQGCVRCRRDTAVGGPAGSSSGPAAQPRAVRDAERPASVAAQVLVAALLVGGTGGMLWAAHQQVVASFGSVFGAGAPPPAGVDAAAIEGYDPGSAAEPAAYPPDGVTVGPAEQDRQMRELLRQMQEDDKADAETAARVGERAAARDDYPGELAEPPQ
jgi:hypothetical protein